MVNLGLVVVFGAFGVLGQKGRINKRDNGTKGKRLRYDIQALRTPVYIVQNAKTGTSISILKSLLAS